VVSVVLVVQHLSDLVVGVVLAVQADLVHKVALQVSAALQVYQVLAALVVQVVYQVQAADQVGQELAELQV
jgi:hypothetical protein